MAADESLVVLKDEDSNDIERLKDLSFCFEEVRLESFKDWPFQEPAKCTPEAMAQAGFVHCPSDGNPDAVRCFFCCKELDGWEPEDDPWDEHVSHTKGKCQYLAHAETYESSIPFKKFLELEIVRQQNIVKRRYEYLIQRVKNQAKEVREKMQQLV